ncbi:MAG: flippase-like domain-containing protein [Deltaproteobacteria bacterium]|nr:flippase-like domain-containing protein [Deltaproteobacteria bacterium]
MPRVEDTKPAETQSAQDATAIGSGQAAPKPVKRFGLKVLIGLTITGGLILFLFRYVDWHHVVALSHDANWWLLAAVIPIYEILYVFRAQRFVLLAPRTPFSVMLCIGAIHNFMLRILPMRTGELSYAFLVRRAGTSGIGESLLGLFLLRVLDATAVVIIFATTLALNQAAYQGDTKLGLLVALGVALLGALTALFFRQLLTLGFTIFAGTLRIVRLTRNRKVAAMVDHLGELIRSYAKLTLRTILAQAALTLIVWMINFVIVFLIMRAFAIPVTFPQAVLGGTGATVTGFLPIGGIGSFGALEAGWALGFALVGLSPSLAVASGFAFSFVTFASAALLALLSWIVFRRLVARQELSHGA